MTKDEQSLLEAIENKVNENGVIDWYSILTIKNGRKTYFGQQKKNAEIAHLLVQNGYLKSASKTEIDHLKQQHDKQTQNGIRHLKYHVKVQNWKIVEHLASVLQHRIDQDLSDLAAFKINR